MCAHFAYAAHANSSFSPFSHLCFNPVLSPPRRHLLVCAAHTRLIELRRTSVLEQGGSCLPGSWQVTHLYVLPSLSARLAPTPALAPPRPHLPFLPTSTYLYLTSFASPIHLLHPNNVERLCAALTMPPARKKSKITNGRPSLLLSDYRTAWVVRYRNLFDSCFHKTCP